MTGMLVGTLVRGIQFLPLATSRGVTPNTRFIQCAI